MARAKVAVPLAPGVTDDAAKLAVASSFGVEKLSVPNADALNTKVHSAVFVPASTVSGVAGCGLL